VCQAQAWTDGIEQSQPQSETPGLEAGVEGCSADGFDAHDSNAGLNALAGTTIAEISPPPPIATSSVSVRGASSRISNANTLSRDDHRICKRMKVGESFALRH
jgi:hypothetical protein